MCVCIEEFNDKILCPELSDSELLCLHGEVQKIYVTYCLEESIDKISFDPFIVEEIHNSECIYMSIYINMLNYCEVSVAYSSYKYLDMYWRDEHHFSKRKMGLVPCCGCCALSMLHAI